MISKNTVSRVLMSYIYLFRAAHELMLVSDKDALFHCTVDSVKPDPLSQIPLCIQSMPTLAKTLGLACRVFIIVMISVCLGMLQVIMLCFFYCCVYTQHYETDTNHDDN
jgi:hypothetical protein